MPNIASSKKRVRTTVKRTAINTARKTRVRGFIRKVEEAITKGDKSAAQAALKVAEPEIMRGVSFIISMLIFFVLSCLGAGRRSYVHLSV